MFDVLKAAPLARLGYHQYTAINNVFDMHMPFMPDDNVSRGVLAGSVAEPEPEKVHQHEKEKEVHTGS